ncbi:MAG: diacylglycerol kinase family protein [Bacteroidales bacterium]
MGKEEKWVFIINPAAGGGFAATTGEKIIAMATIYGIRAETVFTTAKGHASRLSAEYAAKGFSHIIGVGGDGTFNEVAGPLAGNTSITTGLVPAGTGNDFIQILGFPGRFEDKDWDIFFKGSTIDMDCGYCNGNIFLNGMGLGFDAQVAAENYTAPGEVKKGGKYKYIWHILKTLLFYREKKMVISTGSGKEETDCFINTVAIGRRFAGGFFLTPTAVANDGLLDVCMVRKLTLPERLHILLMVPKGTHVNDKRVNYYKTPGLSISFTGDVPYHLDGELYFSREFKIDIKPASLRVVYNPGGNHFFNSGIK